MTSALAGYLEFLTERDGAPDPRRALLPAREELFARLEAAPVASRRAVDRAVFLRNLRARRPEPGLDDLTLWLLATAKANQSERFGVGLAEVYGRIDFADGDPVRLHVNLQERYHTRILADVVGMFGLPVPVQPPPLFTRSMVRAMIFLPERLVLPLVGCAEMAGCVAFRSLRDRGTALCADEPEVAARLRLLFDEILADEISHVGYVEARLGATGRRVMRGLYAAIGLRMARGFPELAALFSRDELAARYGGFSLAELVDGVADRAYTAFPV
jgi:hypothetical protein